MRGFQAVFGIAITLFSALTCLAGGVITECSEQALQTAVRGGGLIAFDCEGTIVLTNTISIALDTVIDGSGRALTISGGGQVRLFNITAGKSLALKNLTLADGMKLGANGSYSFETGKIVQPETVGGGAIAGTNATLVVDACTFSNNLAKAGEPYLNVISFVSSEIPTSAGGAISLEGGRLTINSSQFVANQAVPVVAFSTPPLLEYNALGFAKGGAVAVSNCAVVITNSVFRGNKAGTPGGGALSAENCSIKVNGCTFDGNLAPGNNNGRWTVTPVGDGRGGALLLRGTPAEITFSSFNRNSSGGGTTYHGEVAAAEGGAIYTDRSVELRSASFQENGTAANAAGGALYAGADATLSFCLFVGNVAAGVSITADPAGGGTAGSGFGGGLFGGGALNISSSSFLTNRASGGVLFSIPGVRADRSGSGQGGAIYSKGSLMATNLTVALNEATAGTTSNTASGGGVYLIAPTNQFSYSTVASNRISFSGYVPPLEWTPDHAGEQITVESNGIVTLHGCILAGTSSNLISAGLIDLGFNLSSDQSLSASSSRNGIDAKLSDPREVGWSRGVASLLPESPAIDRGDPGDFPLEDGRGRSRPAGLGPDIGAYEYRMENPLGTLRITALPAGAIRLTFGAEGVRGAVLERTTAFHRWEPVATNTAGTTMDFTLAADEQSQFFRLRGADLGLGAP